MSFSIEQKTWKAEFKTFGTVIMNCSACGKSRIDILLFHNIYDRKSYSNTMQMPEAMQSIEDNCIALNH